MIDKLTTQRFNTIDVISDANRLDIIVGNAVLELLQDEDFQSYWDNLYTSCSWATIFQSREFVTAWYQVYYQIYQPIIVIRHKHGKLTGVLALCFTDNKYISGAGLEQAEYQVWLSFDTDNGKFAQDALKMITQQFPKFKLRLKYVPEKAPLKGMIYDKYLKSRIHLRFVKQPLLRIDDNRLNKELKKKNRKEKLNRLRRLGELRFERIVDFQVFNSVFNELAMQYDFRKAAMFNSTFFHYDDYRKRFLLKLFENQLLHATLLKINDEIIASNVGVIGKGCVHLQGINSHAPTYSKYSPGILHFLMLGKLLSNENIEVFDLTPGADSYKERLATEFGKVSELIVSKDVKKQFFKRIHLGFKSKLKSNLLKLGIDNNDLKIFKKKCSLLKEKIKVYVQLSPLVVFDLLHHLIKANTGLNTYCIDEKGNGESHILEKNINKNSLVDLLNYSQVGGIQSRWEFLEQSMLRLERGECSYTWRESGHLKGCAWYEPSKQTTDRGGSSFGESVVLKNVYLHPKEDMASLSCFLQIVARKLICEDRVEKVYVSVISNTVIDRYMKQIR